MALVRWEKNAGFGARFCLFQSWARREPHPPTRKGEAVIAVYWIRHADAVHSSFPTILRNSGLNNDEFPQGDLSRCDTGCFQGGNANQISPTVSRMDVMIPGSRLALTGSTPLIMLIVDGV